MRRFPVNGNGLFFLLWGHSHRFLGRWQMIEATFYSPFLNLTQCFSFGLLEGSSRRVLYLHLPREDLQHGFHDFLVLGVSLYSRQSNLLSERASPCSFQHSMDHGSFGCG